jgi:hypothetical protein
MYLPLYKGSKKQSSGDKSGPNVNQFNQPKDLRGIDYGLL